MLDRLCSLWFWFGSNRPGFFLGTALLLTAIVLMYSGGIQSSLSLGPGGDFPRFKDPLLYAFSHEDLSSLLVNMILLLLLGPCQERRWGTAAFLALSILSTVILPPLYTLVIFIGGGETSRICGYSATQLTLFTAQCRQVKQKKLLRCVPVWFLPWIYLLFSLLLLPSTPALLHFCAICIGHNYHQSFVGFLQELEHTRIFAFIADWACIVTSTRFRLPTYSTSQRSGSPLHTVPTNQVASSSWPPMRDPSVLSQRPWSDPVPPWMVEGSTPMSEAQLMEEQMLRAGIIASLQDVPEDPSAKVEVAKSSVSSLRLQQLEKMGFPTEKAVVALAASKQLDGAISLLIDDRVGDEAVVITKGKSILSQQGP